MKKVSAAICMALSLALLGGCANQSLTGTSYSREEARQVQHVRYGTVESVTPVVIEGDERGIVGTGAGAIIGGIAGSKIGGGSGSDIAAVLGAVAGGIAGQKIEQAVTKKQGQEVTVMLNNGEMISVVQEVGGGQMFRPGEHVRILQRGGVTRVVY